MIIKIKKSFEKLTNFIITKKKKFKKNNSVIPMEKQWEKKILNCYNNW